MHVKLHVWRQAGPSAPGAMETIDVPGISEEMSFLEMLDIVDERLNAEGRDPIAFEHDCREGICGSCGMMINGQAHGPQKDRKHTSELQSLMRTSYAVFCL